MLMAAAARQPPKVLDGLKEIAYELGIVWGRSVSVSWAWKLCTTKHDPIPCHSRGRHGFGVFASALVEWAERQPMWRRRA